MVFPINLWPNAAQAYHHWLRESFAANFVRLLGEPARLAEVHFLEAIPAGDLDGRRRIAELSRERIVAAMEQR